MFTARRLAAALAIVGAGILAYAVPVSASPQPEHHSGDCVDGTDAANLVADIDPATGDSTVQGTGPLCEPVDIVMTAYRVPDTWHPGDGFPGAALPGGGFSAVPQHIFGESDFGTLEGEETLRLHVDLPDCGNVQADLYYPPEIKDIDANGTGAGLLVGKIWQVTPPEDCEEHTSSPPPSPSRSPETTTPAPPPIVQPIPVPPAAPKPPQLAATGSNNTVPLVGLGAILLGAGIGLSLIGRRRTA